MYLKIDIPGKPIAKKRPRFYVRGRHVGAYNPQETEEGKFLALASRVIAPVGKIPAGISISLQCDFFMPIPESWPKRKKVNPGQHIKKPDLDNMVKFVKDCFNGVLWHDDSQVNLIVASKTYDDNPRTELYVRWGE